MEDEDDKESTISMSKIDEGKHESNKITNVKTVASDSLELNRQIERYDY